MDPSLAPIGRRAGLEAGPEQVTTRLYWRQEHTQCQVHAAQTGPRCTPCFVHRKAVLALKLPPQPQCTPLPVPHPASLVWTVRHSMASLRSEPVPYSTSPQNPTRVPPQPSGYRVLPALWPTWSLGTALSPQADEETGLREVLAFVLGSVRPLMSLPASMSLLKFHRTEICS